MELSFPAAVPDREASIIPMFQPTSHHHVLNKLMRKVCFRSMLAGSVAKDTWFTTASWWQECMTGGCLPHGSQEAKKD